MMLALVSLVLWCVYSFGRYMAVRNQLRVGRSAHARHIDDYTKLDPAYANPSIVSKLKFFGKENLSVDYIFSMM